MLLLDARRLTGPNLYAPVPGVVVELRLDDGEDAAAVADRYFDELTRMTDAVGLPPPRASAAPIRRFRAGVAVLFTGPIDTLLAAAEAAEWAAEGTAQLFAGGPQRALEPKRTEIAALIAAQRSPALLALAAEAHARGLPFLWDDERVSIGAGARCLSYARGDVPALASIPWEALGSIPIALITGTNGKTTSARLVARMVREGGRVPGCTSTDGVTVNELFVERGDCTGPFAARTVLTRPEVEVAVLETARGGILRRGLAVTACDVALLTNVSADHLGTYGIDDVPAMARVKAVVAHAARPGGRVVLCADDAHLRAMQGELGAKVVLFSLDASNELVAKHRARGGEAWFERGGQLVRARGAQEDALLASAQVPITYGGAARFNIANALGAAATASALGVADAAIVAALRGFTPTAADNEGRSNLLVVDGVRVLLDFAHNAAGIAAVLELVAAIRGGSRLTVVTGHPGDRSDDALREIAGILFLARPQRVLLRELSSHLRGRQPGEVRAVLRGELLRLGLAPEAVSETVSEVAALEEVLTTARAGDVVLLLVHTERAAVRELLALRGAVGG